MPKVGLVGIKIAVLDYGIGNLRSAEKALQKVGADAQLTSSPTEIEIADGVVLPGVGAFGSCMGALHETGLVEQLELVVSRRQPLLGICVGMQLLYEWSEESPGVAGLGLLDGGVKKLPDSVKHPQMQWNQLDVISNEYSFVNGFDKAWMYFVHSYAVQTGPEVIATVNYGGDQPAIVAKGAILATQFHPEKSSDSGLSFLKLYVNSLNSNSRVKL